MANTKPSGRIKQYESKLESSNRKYKFYKFPLDLETEGTGNIMMININVPSGSQFIGKQYKVVEGEEAVIEQDGSGSLSRKFKGNTSRIDTAIALHMPAGISSSYQSDWSSTDLGIAGAVMDAWTSLGSFSDFETYKNAFNTAKEQMPHIMMKTAASVISTLTPFNVKDAYTFYSQTVDNPYTEVIFNRVNNRTFSFSFKFTPRSRKEQEEIQNIVKTLKFHRAPEARFTQANNYWLFPSTFDITFLKKNGQVNEWLFAISTCALTNLTVEQGSDTHFATFEDGSPFTTSIKMDFLEMEAILKDRILSNNF